MPRRNALRDNVAAVRSRLTNFPNLSRDKIELALLYYESDIDATVEAFQRGRFQLRLVSLSPLDFVSLFRWSDRRIEWLDRNDSRSRTCE